MAFVFFSPSPSLSRYVDILCQPTHTTMHKEISTTDSDSSSSLSVLFSVFDRCMTNCVPHREEALAQTGFGSHKKCAHQIALFHTRKCNRQICIDRRKRKLHHSSSILSNFIITGWSLSRICPGFFSSWMWKPKIENVLRLLRQEGEIEIIIARQFFLHT